MDKNTFVTKAIFCGKNVIQKTKRVKRDFLRRSKNQFFFFLKNGFQKKKKKSKND